MPLISRGLYSYIEARLHNHTKDIERAEARLKEARARAYAASQAPADPNGGGRASGRHDKVERAAIRVTECEEQLRKALAWDDVCVRLRRICSENELAGQVGRWIYDRGLTQADCCRMLNRDRKTVRKLQDKYIMNALLLAVEAQLVKLEDYSEEGTEH